MRLRITEQNLIWCVEKLQWKFIPITIAPLPFQYFYSHSHAACQRPVGPLLSKCMYVCIPTPVIVTVTPIPMGIPWDRWDPNCSYSHAHLNLIVLILQFCESFRRLSEVRLGSYVNFRKVKLTWTYSAASNAPRRRQRFLNDGADLC